MYLYLKVKGKNPVDFCSIIDQSAVSA